MEKTILSLGLLACAMGAQAQENNGFRLHSAGVGFGGYYSKKDRSEGGGISGTAQITTAIGNNLFAATYLGGREMDIIGDSNYNFNEASLKYGREVTATNWLRFEFLGGVGLYNQNSDDVYVESGNAVSFPLTVNSKFYFGQHFGVGLNVNYSFNSINNNFSPNILFHYRF